LRLVRPPGPTILDSLDTGPASLDTGPVAAPPSLDTDLDIGPVAAQAHLARVDHLAPEAHLAQAAMILMVTHRILRPMALTPAIIGPMALTPAIIGPMALTPAIIGPMALIIPGAPRPNPRPPHLQAVTMHRRAMHRRAMHRRVMHPPQLWKALLLVSQEQRHAPCSHSSTRITHLAQG